MSLYDLRKKMLSVCPEIHSPMLYGFFDKEVARLEFRLAELEKEFEAALKQDNQGMMEMKGEAMQELRFVLGKKEVKKDE